MWQFFSDLIKAPLAMILVVSGIAFLGLAAIGGYEKLQPGRFGRALALGAGAVLLVLGLLSGRAGPANGGGSTPAPTPTPIPTSVPTPAETPTPTPAGAGSPNLTVIWEPRVNRPGFDLQDLEVGNQDQRACEEPCLKRPDCKSFVYFKPGVQKPGAVCRLKSELPQAVLDQDCCIAGVVKERALRP